MRFRQRYVDLLSNATGLDALRKRARVMRFLRDYLDERGFLEVETPILSRSSGGANARPFVTRSDALSTDMQLRIAPELYLKQLLVGGVERVYEIGKVFRNEGLSPVHAPEFTTCEFYVAFADYTDLMTMTEHMVPKLVHAVTGSTVLRVPRSLASHCNSDLLSGDDEHVSIDFTPPFQRLSVMTELRKRFDHDIPCPSNEDAFRDALLTACEKENALPETPHTTGRLLDALIGHVIEPQCLRPTFITDHPTVLSPLAKAASNGDGGHASTTERFELFVAGKELINAYSELNDPREQRKRFEQQTSAREEGDEEGMAADETFCTALEYAMPPAAGWGLGIDRLCMILTGTEHIREVQAFPITASSRCAGQDESKSVTPDEEP